MSAVVSYVWHSNTLKIAGIDKKKQSCNDQCWLIIECFTCFKPLPRWNIWSMIALVKK